jgi:hypothetical protein
MASRAIVFSLPGWEDIAMRFLAIIVFCLAAYEVDPGIRTS